MPDRPKPPRLGTLVLSVFSTEPDFPEIEGDLSEEFHDRVETAGATTARRWFVWEALRNATALALRQFSRSPIETLVIAIGCLLLLNLPPFLTLFEVHHRRLPNLEWSTFALICRAYFVLMPPLLGAAATRLVPGRAFSLAATVAGLHMLGGTLRLLDYFLLEPFVFLPAHWNWWWAIVGFGAASLAFQNRRSLSTRTAE